MFCILNPAFTMPNVFPGSDLITRSGKLRKFRYIIFCFKNTFQYERNKSFLIYLKTLGNILKQSRPSAFLLFIITQAEILLIT